MKPKSALRERIGQILIEKKLITKDQLAEALKVQKEKKERLGELLVNLGYLSKDALLEVLSIELNIPAVHLARTKILPEVVRMVPKKMADRYCLVPVSVVGDTISVAMSDPMNVNAIDDLRHATGKAVRPLLAIDKDVREAIE